MKNFMSDLAISLCGLVTTAVTVAALVFMELEWDFAFYSLLHFFVIPTGAIISGAGAASGYYFGALLLHTKPTIRILLNMMLISVLAYFSINYVLYSMLEVDGVAVSTLIAFSEFLDLLLTNMSMSIGRETSGTGELGSLGYVVVLLQIVGFALGGLVVYIFLRKKPYCDHCNKYFKRVWQDKLFTGDAENYVGQVQQVAALARTSGVEEARTQHGQIGFEDETKETHIRAELTLLQCASCTRELLTFETYRRKGDRWDLVDELSFSESFLPDDEGRTS